LTPSWSRFRDKGVRIFTEDEGRVKNTSVWTLELSAKGVVMVWSRFRDKGARIFTEDEGQVKKTSVWTPELSAKGVVMVIRQHFVKVSDLCENLEEVVGLNKGGIRVLGMFQRLRFTKKKHT
jgi:hypothetical protein